jgi:hypothetical protein
MSIAAQVLYRDQYIAAFERRESVLRPAVTTDTESRGSAVYSWLPDRTTAPQ